MTGDRFHSFEETSFGGVTCAQYWCDFMLWEAVLNSNLHLSGIVEIGTWAGGFSRYLYAQAAARGMDFVTFDVVEPTWPTSQFAYHKLDVFRYPDEVATYCGHPVALFCDGGNKPRELQTFPQLCAVGSIFLVHDWGTETGPDDVPEGLVEIYGDYCDEIGSITRVFAARP